MGMGYEKKKWKNGKEAYEKVVEKTYKVIRRFNQKIIWSLNLVYFDAREDRPEALFVERSDRLELLSILCSTILLQKNVWFSILSHF